ncbi:tetratricopeptide repeat protein, partial [Vibrio alfacsensis]|uniref:tetratricopeptide repeat protein n=1 Tax=Vibrio alfacsensis TaxID=1074311 RepID=UPI0040679A05
NDKEAVKWYRKAAEQGHASAQCNLGVMYAKGDGVLENDKEAVKWYRKAAEQGDADAQFNLGVMYAKGEGVVKNPTKAYMWLILAKYNGVDVSTAMSSLFLHRANKNEAQRMAQQCLDSNYKNC